MSSAPAPPRVDAPRVAPPRPAPPRVETRGYEWLSLRDRDDAGWTPLSRQGQPFSSPGFQPGAEAAARSVFLVLVLAVLLALLACAPSSPPAAPETASSPPPTATPAPNPAGRSEPGEPLHPPALPAPVILPSAPGEAGVRAFVTEFMEARQRGKAARARDFLSPTALEQFGPGGLSLAGDEDGRSFSRWELLSLQAADANSWEVKVRLFYPGGTEGDVQFDETLFIGPGPDASDTQRVWIVRGATES